MFEHFLPVPVAGFPGVFLPVKYNPALENFSSCTGTVVCAVRVPLCVRVSRVCPGSPHLAPALPPVSYSSFCTVPVKRHRGSLYRYRNNRPLAVPVCVVRVPSCVSVSRVSRVCPGSPQCLRSTRSMAMDCLFCMPLRARIARAPWCESTEITDSGFAHTPIP